MKTALVIAIVLFGAVGAFLYFKNKAAMPPIANALPPATVGAPGTGGGLVLLPSQVR